MSEPILLIVIPLAGSLLALTGKLVSLGKTFTVLALSSFAAMTGVLIFQYAGVVEGGSTISTLGGYDGEPGIAMTLNGPAWLASVLIVLIASLVAVFSLNRPGSDPRYFFFLLMMVAGMETVVLTGDIFTMFVGLEVVALAAYVLIAWERSGEGLLASLKYLFLSSVGILFFLLGVFIVYRELGSLSFTAISRRLAELGTVSGGSSSLGNGFFRGIREIQNTGAISFAVAALCVGIGVRTAFIPFHTWLPEAHAWAPHPISALLSGVLIKISFFAMFRILGVFSAFRIYPTLMWLGAITAPAAALWALAQSDLKKLLAYHSISQMGYIMAAAAAGSAFSLPAAYSHAVNHALFKSLLFLAVGEAIRISGERDLFRIGPMGRRSPLTAAALMIGALSIAGVPPFNGFVSKQLIAAALEASPVGLLLRGSAVVTTASFIKLSRIVLPGPVPPPGESRIRRRPSVVTLIPLGALSALALLSGIFGKSYVLFLWRMAGGRANSAGVPSFFKLEKLLDSLITLVLGVAVYRLVMTPVGKRMANRVKRVAPRLRTVLIFFVFGLMLFTAALLP